MSATRVGIIVVGGVIAVVFAVKRRRKSSGPRPIEVVGTNPGGFVGTAQPDT